jgi:hypothetical protein
MKKKAPCEGEFGPSGNLQSGVPERLLLRRRWKVTPPTMTNPCPAISAGNECRTHRFVQSGVIPMLTITEKRPAKRTMRGWAIDVLQNAGAISECEEHGWMRDRADPHAWERAIHIAREDPPARVSSDAAVAEVRDVLNSIGDTCPECPPD